MTQTPSRPLLPMTGHTMGTRSAATCHFKCGDACLRDEGSLSASPHFAEVARAAVSRRSVLQALGLTAAAVGASTFLGTPRAQAATAPAAGEAVVSPTFRFRPVEPVDRTVDAVTVPAGYAWHTLVQWGDPVVPGAPAFDLDRQSPEAQAMQFGYNNDYLTIVPQSSTRALLVANHEYTNENLMYPGFVDEASLTDEQIRTSMAAHGMSVVQLRRYLSDPRWYADSSRWNRRITALGTPFRLTGPVAGDALVRTTRDPAGRTVIGTLNNCAGGTTPWRTVLSGEENFDQYFRGDPVGDPRNRDTYGLVDATGTPGDGRFWYRVDDRFDVVAEPNEINRFGWIVELDPRDPGSTPVKHTALGRFKHEGATVSLAADRRVAVYMGDDTADQHLYKFVSEGRLSPGGTNGPRLLERGDLYVARFSAEGDPSTDHDGTGEWVPLTRGGRSMVPGMTLAEVLVFTREAAAAVGATPMDRPEDVERNPVNGRVYVACTNSSNRAAAGVANPRPGNRWGHVVELREDGDDAGATTFTWTLALVCGDPADPSTHFAGFPADRVSPISCPDNLTFDSRGGLWISTDGQPGSLGLNDALHYVPVDGPERGHVQQFLAVPTGAETCGPVVDDEGDSVFICVQHPGETADAVVDAPSSLFPYGGTTRTPRPAVVQVYREGGLWRR
ncbi:PhoX family protein [Cellulomonas endophytica]|uniref:PhoX family protein n=1 Tax=Cellulomonas endophytica TaxID=2494735 RepID=UPI0010124F11|nr:PhoX family phosphatase [Cellulomonas endophytica]